MATATPSTTVLDGEDLVPASLTRLESILRQVQGAGHDAAPHDAHGLSIIEGTKNPALLYTTLGDLLAFQSLQYHDLECFICPWTGARWTYGFLEQESHRLALGLLALDVQKGDRIGVMAGNCEQYVALFFAAARVGAVLVVINNTYTTSEVLYALKHTGCKLFFAVSAIGRHNLIHTLETLGGNPTKRSTAPDLKHIVLLRGGYRNFMTYEDVISEGQSQSLRALRVREDQLKPEDICNLQFTSGSTGDPKAAALTHQSVSFTVFFGNEPFG